MVFTFNYFDLPLSTLIYLYWFGEATAHRRTAQRGTEFGVRNAGCVFSRSALMFSLSQSVRAFDHGRQARGIDVPVLIKEARNRFGSSGAKIC